MILSCFLEEEEVDRVIYKLLEAISKSQALVLLGDFNYPDFWRGNAGKHKQSRKFLEILGHIFLLNVVEDPAENYVVLDLLQNDREGLGGDMKVGNMKVGSSLAVASVTVEFSLR